MKPLQPELQFDPRPRTITPETSEEFFDLCARVDLKVVSVQVGRTPGEWICRVRYCEQQGNNLDLLILTEGG